MAAFFLRGAKATASSNILQSKQVIAVPFGSLDA
jgi:hypothetical protein